MDYQVRFINPQRHFNLYGKEFMRVLNDRLANGKLILQEDVTEFEAHIAEMCGTKYAIGVNSGFDALRLSLEALGIKEGDEVITVAHTFLASISAIVKTGATPVLLDVGEDWNMNVSEIEKRISKRTKAIIPVHLNGRMCDMEGIMAIAKKYDLFVIEDACQSLTASFKKRKAGAWGVTGCFSFYPFKILGAFGEAGAITTNNVKIAQKLILLRYHGVDRTPARRIHCYGWNAVLDNIQAAILNVKIKYFPKWIERRREIASMYERGLSNIKNLKLPHFHQSQYHDVYQNYVIQTKKRNALKKFLEEKGVQTLISWPMPIYRHKELNLPARPLPQTERICKEVLSLPLYPELTNKEITSVINHIHRFYR